MARKLSNLIILMLVLCSGCGDRSPIGIVNKKKKRVYVNNIVIQDSDIVLPPVGYEVIILIKGHDQEDSDGGEFSFQGIILSYSSYLQFLTLLDIEGEEQVIFIDDIEALQIISESEEVDCDRHGRNYRCRRCCNRRYRHDDD